MEKNVARGTVEEGWPWPTGEELKALEKQYVMDALLLVKEGKMPPAEALRGILVSSKPVRRSELDEQYKVSETLQALVDNKPGSRMKLDAVIRALQAD
jgi:hypothetical protein